jgi:hypothetical protein
VRAALATLPWVEQDTVKISVPRREVKFGVKEKDQFDLQALKDALDKQGFHEVATKSGPT